MTKEIKMWKWKCFILVPGVRGSQPDHSGRQHLPHRLFPRRTIHEVKTKHKHKRKHRQCVSGTEARCWSTWVTTKSRGVIFQTRCALCSPQSPGFCFQCIVQGVFFLPIPLKFLSKRKKKVAELVPLCGHGLMLIIIFHLFHGDHNLDDNHNHWKHETVARSTLWAQLDFKNHCILVLYTIIKDTDNYIW